jgi:hypothetical protein
MTDEEANQINDAWNSTVSTEPVSKTYVDSHLKAIGKVFHHDCEELRAELRKAFTEYRINHKQIKEEIERCRVWREEHIDAIHEKLEVGTTRFDFKATELIIFTKKHWKTISLLAGAFGLPVGLADPGAFTSILGIFKNLWPF